MAEYFDREMCLSILRAKANMAVLMGAAPYFEKTAKMLEKLPTADVVPVVRCMDCKHLIAVNVNGKGIPTCRVSGMKVAPNEFCSRGEKGRR